MLEWRNSLKLEGRVIDVAEGVDLNTGQVLARVAAQDTLSDLLLRVRLLALDTRINGAKVFKMPIT